MTTWHHDQRLEAVCEELRGLGARSVLDLGCGGGDLLVRLAAWPELERLVGIDICAASLERLGARLRAAPPVAARVEVRLASMTAGDATLSGFDCAVMLEAIEHVDPGHLDQVERAVFARMRPGAVLITTPNAEFNPLLGVPPGRFRHPGHRFEWSRAQFRRWAGRVAAAQGYGLRWRDVAGCHPDLGGASQMAIFQREPGRAAP